MNVIVFCIQYVVGVLFYLSMTCIPSKHVVIILDQFKLVLLEVYEHAEAQNDTVFGL